jgi:hypothetical protein
MTSVKLYVYDLSQGMAKQMSLGLTGRQIGMYSVNQYLGTKLSTGLIRLHKRWYLAHFRSCFRPRILLWPRDHEFDSR